MLVISGYRKRVEMHENDAHHAELGQLPPTAQQGPREAVEGGDGAELDGPQR